MLIAPQCLDSGGPECLGSAAVIGRLDVKSGGNGGWARRAGVGYGRVERALEWIPGEQDGLGDSRRCLRGLRRALSTRSNFNARGHAISPACKIAGAGQRKSAWSQTAQRCRLSPRA
jgi:hypothetical protein